MWVCKLILKCFSHRTVICSRAIIQEIYRKKVTMTTMFYKTHINSISGRIISYFLSLHIDVYREGKNKYWNYVQACAALDTTYVFSSNIYGMYVPFRVHFSSIDFFFFIQFVDIKQRWGNWTNQIFVKNFSHTSRLQNHHLHTFYR